MKGYATELDYWYAEFNSSIACVVLHDISAFENFATFEKSGVAAELENFPNSGSKIASLPNTLLNGSIWKLSALMKCW